MPFAPFLDRGRPALALDRGRLASLWIAGVSPAPSSQPEGVLSTSVLEPAARGSNKEPRADWFF